MNRGRRKRREEKRRIAVEPSDLGASLELGVYSSIYLCADSLSFYLMHCVFDTCLKTWNVLWNVGVLLVPSYLRNYPREMIVI